jgi:hypothetical protein
MNIQLPKPIGRPANKIEYNDVYYNDKKYVVCKVPYKDEDLKFVIDKEDFDKVDGYSWHRCSNNYISQGVIVDGKKKEFYLHNLILNIFDFPGKGSKESVDHINRIGLDNRKDNLKISSVSEQRLNQNTRKRKIELPEDSGLVADDIPKHIWYVKSNGSHGERFAIELNTENIIWKTTASKNISLKDKLESAKKQLEDYYKLYPHLNPNNEDKTNKIKELTESYNEIIRLSEQ